MSLPRLRSSGLTTCSLRLHLLRSIVGQITDLSFFAGPLSLPRRESQGLLQRSILSTKYKLDSVLASLPITTVHPCPSSSIPLTLFLRQAPCTSPALRTQPRTGTPCRRASQLAGLDE